jgi:hypothetical protein
MKDIPYKEWSSDMWRWAKKQINFIKRDKWKSSKEKVNLKEAFSMLQNVKKNFTDGYKKNYWEKKIYE